MRLVKGQTYQSLKFIVYCRSLVAHSFVLVYTILFIKVDGKGKEQKAC
jgi:hypothetical protein